MCSGQQSPLYEGSLVGVKPKDESSGLMPWESLMVEWDDETQINTVNPWEVEAVSAETAARRRALVGSGGDGGGGPA